MPNPKRRHSKTRTAKRRTHDALKPVGLSECPHCHEPKPPHRVCANCGYYRGRQAQGGRRRLEFRTADPEMIWIAVDAMGGDFAPRHVGRRRARGRATFRSRRGARRPGRARSKRSSRGCVDVDRDRVRHRRRAARWSTMDEAPAAALRRKPRASIRVAAELVARRRGGGAVQRRATPARR